MVIVCATVFLGTIYPLLVEAFSNNKISVGEPYYNSTVIVDIDSDGDMDVLSSSSTSITIYENTNSHSIK